MVRSVSHIYYISIHVYICTYIYIYVYIYIYTHLHIYIYTYIIHVIYIYYHIYIRIFMVSMYMYILYVYSCPCVPTAISIFLQIFGRNFRLKVPGANLAFPVPGDLPRTFGPQGPHGELHGGLKRIAWGWMDI